LKLIFAGILWHGQKVPNITYYTLLFFSVLELVPEYWIWLIPCSHFIHSFKNVPVHMIIGVGYTDVNTADF
jgi:hypothetical protein